MDHLHALAAAVADNPGDRHTRLMLADALEEAGRVEEAELLRQPGVFAVPLEQQVLIWIVEPDLSARYVKVHPDFPRPVCQAKRHTPLRTPDGQALFYFHPEHGWYCEPCANLWTLWNASAFIVAHP